METARLLRKRSDLYCCFSLESHVSPSLPSVLCTTIFLVSIHVFSFSFLLLEIDPYCRCTSHKPFSTAPDPCCSFPLVDSSPRPSVILIDDPHHEVLSANSSSTVFAVISCKRTDYENLNFDFDIRMNQVDESAVGHMRIKLSAQKYLFGSFCFARLLRLPPSFNSTIVCTYMVSFNPFV